MKRRLSGSRLRGIATSTCLALVTLAGCAVTPSPVQHLQLAAGAGATGAARGDGPRVYIDRVELPDYLLRDELIHRDDAYTLTYVHSRRWAEPLDLGIQRVLGEDLAALLDTRHLRRFPMPAAGDTQLNLRVTIQRFELVGDRAELLASGVWRQGSEATVTLAEVSFEDRIAIDGDTASATAQALSELLGRFARALLEGLP